MNDFNEFVNLSKTVCVLLNQYGTICYSNTDNIITEQFLEYLDVNRYLSTCGKTDFHMKCYCASIDKIELNKEVYYLILIQHEKISFNNAYIDILTGLYNRNFWEQFCDGIISRLGTDNFSLVLIDVDDLKKYNDTYGHLEGDKIIKIVGQSIKDSIRKEDLGIRYGGDEFIILIFNGDKNIGSDIIKRVRREIRKKSTDDTNIQISAGVYFGKCLNDINKIIEMADSNLYSEKKSKKRQSDKNDILKKLDREIKIIQNDLKSASKYKVADEKYITDLKGKIGKLDNIISKYLKKYD